LIMFFGSYQNSDFSSNGNYSLKNVLIRHTYANNTPQYPKMSIANDGPFYFSDTSNWPLTDKNIPRGGVKTYFGNTESLLSNGLKNDFDLYVNPNDRKGGVQTKSSFSALLPDSVMNKRIWSSPESSHFFQYLREADELVPNFSKGLRFPALGGSPYSLTPLKMAEMFGKMASLNPIFRGTIDKSIRDSIPWNYDATWKSLSNYESFLDENIFKGMQDAIETGTARSLTGGESVYKGYHLYAKTGTIGNTNNEDSKRLGIIITKNPVKSGEIKNNRFYIVYFTINNAYDSDDSDKSWFWKFYRQTLDQIIMSQSFKNYMTN